MTPEPDPSSNSSYPGNHSQKLPMQRSRQAKRTATDGIRDRNSEPGECRFIFVRWPSGSWTIALDREYASMEMDEF